MIPRAARHSINGPRWRARVQERCRGCFPMKVGLTFAQWRQRVRFHNAMEAIVRGEPIGRVGPRKRLRERQRLYRSVSQGLRRHAGKTRKVKVGSDPEDLARLVR